MALAYRGWRRIGGNGGIGDAALTERATNHISPVISKITAINQRTAKTVEGKCREKLRHKNMIYLLFHFLYGKEKEVDLWGDGMVLQCSGWSGRYSKWCTRREIHWRGDMYGIRW